VTGVAEAGRDRLSRRREVGAAAAGLLGAFLVGAASLTYRFGRDQAIFYYVGRGWLEGALPYRDAFDLKPPGLYAAHALSIAALGDNEAAARVLDLVGVLAAGALALAAVPGRRAIPGALGLGALLFAGWHYTLLDFWQTAQAEVWVALWALAALVVLGGAPNRPLSLRRALVAGVLAGVGPTFKLTGVVLGVPVALALVVRAWRDAGPLSLRRRIPRAAGALGVYAAGAALPTAAFAAALALAGGGEALVDAVGYVRRYAGQANWFIARERMVGFYLEDGLPWHLPFLGLWVYALWDAARRRDRPRLEGGLLAFVLFATAFGTVVLQRKFFDYHWGVTGPFLVMMAGGGLVAVARITRPAAAWALAVGVTVVGLALAPPWNANPRMTWGRYQGVAARYLTGDLDERDFLRHFVAEARYDYLSHRRIADAIQARGGAPGDGLHVRGFELAMYAITGMRSPSRFVSELPLDNPAWAYRREAWRAEHARALRDDPPRFFVTFRDRPTDLRALRARGYVPVAREGMFVLLERAEVSEGRSE